MDTFTGFPAAALEFYVALEDNNNREWWEGHKDKYDADVLAPISALLRNLEPRFGPGRIFRPYRDMRFSPNKAPYKPAQGIFLSHYEDVGYYLHLSAAGLSIGGGYRSAAPAQLARYRAAVDATSSGTALVGIVEQLEAAGFAIAEPELKTMPRGFPKDHPRPQLLRHKTLSASLELGRPDWLESGSAQQHIADHWEQLRPLVDWVIRHAAP
ncbi:hypothetical protein ART_2243 [Arthrobacter sp. PAMC 25486]|uniref:DUF2461 domain-containing protein n=1 Tax=Arthrobacter sp. PAMC 25486 TaxID=1494608 RepID=UPI0005363526|nr:DUF2461 domain-containing protein [Arthrobacter sp. PAMC 25486]AIY01842.1 hypothetical protein ART_2243 [Arthrobacter sp. PAMC 25486]